ERIAASAERMGRLLSEILELSRIGRQVNPAEEVSLNVLAAEAIESLRGSITKSGAEVDVRPGLPEVFGDRRRLGEVFQNLLENAVKYRGDQRRPRIEIGGEERGGEVLCYVRDNGLGIEPEYHEGVFRLFNQLDPSCEGSGVGLALVKRIVDVHGGKVWVESAGRGHGATFWFTLKGSPRPA
ncbi:MAG: ATP-binding protein, partial [Pirellulales bacterium]|nr:ATP-binding protein [Pirellulales bacterium]